MNEILQRLWEISLAFDDCRTRPVSPMLVYEMQQLIIKLKGVGKIMNEAGHKHAGECLTCKRACCNCEFCIKEKDDRKNICYFCWARLTKLGEVLVK